MDILPAPALKVIGEHLDAVDARSCRLASRHFAPVVSKKLSTSHIRIVASAFQQQLQNECKQATATTEDEQLLKGVAGLQTAEHRRNAAEGSVQSEGPNHGSQQPQATITAASSSSSVTWRPGLRSRTAASLARAAAAAGTTRAALYVDVKGLYEDKIWQQVFGALLSDISIVTSLEVIEYNSSTSGGHDAEQLLELRTMRAGMATPAATAAFRADLFGSSSRWLLALAAAYTAAAAPPPWLLHLNLQLPAPLPVDLEPLLLQLTGLKTLKLESTRVWPEQPPGCDYLKPVVPVLAPAVLGGLTALTGLEHLKCDLAASESVQGVLKSAAILDELFGDLNGHLTHLSFGAAPCNTQMCLASPIVSLHNLQELICQPGLLLDTDLITQSLTDDSPLQITAAGSSGGQIGSSGTSPRFQIAPSLTKLVLNDGLDHGALLRLLARQRPVAAAAARTQLVHLELNSQMEMPVEMLGQLAGLRHLKTTVHDKRELQALSQTPLTSQLQGLTIVCTQPGEDFDEWGSTYRPIPLVTPFTSLQTLVVLGRYSIALDPYQDLEALTVITHLERFEFTGQPSESLVIPYLSYQNKVVCRLPSELRSLVLKYCHPYGDRVVEPDAVKFALGAFPSGLTSVKFQGFYSAVDEYEELADQELERTAAPAASTAALSSSSRRAEGLAGLRELSMQFKHLQDAKQWLSYCCNLEHLRLLLGPSRLESGTNTGHAALTESGVNLSQCCPHLKDCEVVVAAPEDPQVTWRSVDDLLAPIWADVAGLTGLKRLSLISEKDSLLFDKTLPYLATLSNLTRLQDLTLQFNLRLTACGVADADPPPATNGPAPKSKVGFATEWQFYEAAHHACGRLVSAIMKCTGLKRLEIATPFVMRSRDPDEGCEYNYIKRPLEQGRANVDRLELGLSNCLVLCHKQVAR